MKAKMKSHLSPARRKLLEIIDSLGFGTIKDLSIRNGEPCFDPFPRILHDIKIGADPAAQPEITNGDFVLKSRIVELFEHLDRIECSTITIEIKHSSPFRLVIEQNSPAPRSSAMIR